MKKLITFLGTGPGKRDDNGKPSMDYRKTRYQFDDGQITEKSAFFGYELFLKSKPAEFHIIGTLQSMWATLYLHLMTTNGYGENDYLELWDQLDSYNNSDELRDILPEFEKQLGKILKSMVKVHIVDLLETSKKMWGFFSYLQRIIKNNDDIFLDVTHGFRHIPIIMMNAMTYLNTYRENLSICGIYYAAFEAKNNPRDEEEPAQVIDLSATWEMNQFFHAVRDFTEFGHGRDLADLLKENHKELSHSIEGFHQAAQISYAKDYFKQLNILFSQFHTPDRIPDSLVLAKPIFEKWFNEQKGDEDWYRQILLSKWYYDRQLYQQAVTLLTEGLISYAMVKANKDYTDELLRYDFANTHLKKYKDRLLWFGSRKLVEFHKNIKAIRNKMNHGGFVKNSSPALVSETYEKLHQIFQSKTFKLFVSGDYCKKDSGK